MNIYCIIDFILYMYHILRTTLFFCLFLCFFELVANSHAYNPQQPMPVAQKQLLVVKWSYDYSEHG